MSTKIEKEKRELAKQHGMVRGEVSGGEIAEEMEKERRTFQLNMCEVRTGTGKWHQLGHGMGPTNLPSSFLSQSFEVCPTGELPALQETQAKLG